MFESFNSMFSMDTPSFVFACKIEMDFSLIKQQPQGSYIYLHLNYWKVQKQTDV